MYNKRTDLALEVHELRGTQSGITLTEEKKDGITVTTAVVKEGEGEKLSGKQAGKYITVDIGKVWQTDTHRFNKIAAVIAAELKTLLPKEEGCILVAGLGNEQITPDSLGPRTVKKLLVTRHISSLDPALYSNAGFGCLAAISPGVLGQTGIESAEIIKSVAKSIKPKCIILIDALASRRLSRLATTVQISNTGISPGSGVSNKRAALTAEYLNSKVISVGIPTVVDAATLAYDLLEQHYGADSDFSSAVEKVLLGSGREMFVTPKENDIISAETAALLATAINVAAHGMQISEIKDFIR